jgi:heat shock protein HslJ
MKLFWVYALVVGCLLFVGCNENNGGGQAAVDTGTQITSENFERIVGMQWILKEMVVDGQAYALTGEMPFVKFEAGGSFNGHASVNRFFGSVAIYGAGKFVWPNAFGTTRMAGPVELMNQESAFLATLPKTEKASLEKIFLTFESLDGKSKLVFYVPVE